MRIRGAGSRAGDAFGLADARSASAERVRADLREHLAAWLKEAGASEAEIFDMVLASTEAFTNAVEHPSEPTSSLVEVQGTITDEAVVTVSIRDYGHWPDEDAEEEQAGIGLAIVEAVTDSFNVDFAEAGTTVTMQRKLGWPDDKPHRSRR